MVSKATASLNLLVSSIRLHLNSDKTPFIWPRPSPTSQDWHGISTRSRCPNAITLPQFLTLVLHWIQFFHSQTISIISLKHPFIICINSTPSGTCSTLTHSKISSKHCFVQGLTLATPSTCLSSLNLGMKCTLHWLPVIQRIQFKF